MRIAEEFERCEKCGQGWFEQKTFALIDKNPQMFWGKPSLHQTEVHLICIGCGHTPYKYTEQY